MAAALTATWEEIKAAGAKPMARSAHGLASAHGTLYLFGGMYSDAEGNPMSLADMFQLSLDGKPQWRAMTPGGDVPVQRQGHTFNYVEALGQYFVFGGSNDDDGTEFNDVVSFDPSRNIWKQGASVVVICVSLALADTQGCVCSQGAGDTAEPAPEPLGQRARVVHLRVWRFRGRHGQGRHVQTGHAFVGHPHAAAAAAVVTVTAATY
jgi:N-acetylneuraminic acid mutarotase